MLDTVIAFLRSVLDHADLGGSRGKLDIFADRLVRAASEPTLAAACEQLLRTTNAETERIHPPGAARMVGIANGPVS